MLVCDDSLKINSLCMHNIVDCGACLRVNPLRANPIKWSNTHTIPRQKPRNCLSVFDHFGLALKR